MPSTLVVNEICRTLQGEGTRCGRRCALVRLTGCNLRCRWCDTDYAWDEGRRMPVADVLEAVSALCAGLVLVTGGEPLLQQAAGDLLARLCDRGWEVLLETNGSRDVSGLDRRVARCVDVKCPGSGEADSFLWSNLDGLAPGDEVKFVLADRGDYEYARSVVTERDLGSRCPVVFTPAAGCLSPGELAGWMLRDDGLPAGIRLGLQLHKILWPGARRASEEGRT